MLKNETWLSEQTREKAIEKLDAIVPRVAYPEKWRDYSKLNIEKGDTLETALEKLNKFGWENFYSKLNTKIDREMWGDNDVIIVNSYYGPSENEIFIIAGILSGDFYGADRSREENLGSIGAVIGHELSHAFDTRGAQFDKNGALKDWWTPEDYEKFQARADKLIKYLSEMKVTPEGELYNGALVQTETIADMAGVKAMLGIAAKDKNFDYDKFFRAYARVWANVMTRERLDYRLKVDVHALPYIRVNAIVQQYDEFYKTYGIKSGDAMYLAPEKRVAVW
ncbi:MAG: M13 family metallopeptidase [Synergistaceae bacterium]|nr:M13 family metallopeptidase [Synergistaceae bacterium]